MTEIDELLRLIDEPDYVCSRPPVSEDDPLLGMLVQLAFSDGVLQDDELALLERLRPDLDAQGVREWLARFDHPTFDARHVAAVVDADAAWKVMQIATRMVCMDGDVAEEELQILQDLAEALRLDERAPQRAVDEVVATGGSLPEERVLASLRNMLWERLEPSRDEPAGPLREVVPKSAEHVATMSMGDEEIAALYLDGLAAMFEEGPRFVYFADIRTYTRVPVPGASFHVHTDAAHLKMSDPRMRDLGELLDYLYGRDPIPDA